MSTNAPEIAPDTKDWTWVLDRPCPDCGFIAGEVPVDRLATAIRDNAATWEAVLALQDAAARPDPATWSPLEYACHVRDVHRIFDLRLRLMLTEDEPTFPNWDQDETAVAERYAEQDPATVAAELLEAAEQVAERYEAVPPRAWERRGLRSNGSAFTVETIGRYHLHDLVHHAWDVRAAVARATVAAYDASADAYRETRTGLPERVRADVERLAQRLAEAGAGRRVLEIGSGPGLDALALEQAGLSVRRTDVSPAFVAQLRAAGHPADVVDPLVDDLEDPQHPATPYDAVWANACLLHVARADLPTVLRRLAGATRADGLLRLSVKEGDGEAWSDHGHVAGRRHVVYWHAEPLREVVEGAGWTDVHLERYAGAETDAEAAEPWLEVWARRRP